MTSCTSLDDITMLLTIATTIAAGMLLVQGHQHGQEGQNGQRVPSPLIVFTPSGRETSIPVAVKKQHMGPHIFSPKRFLHICPVRNQVVLFLIFSVIKLLIAGQETV